MLLLWYYSYHIIVSIIYDAASSPPRPCLIFCRLLSSSTVRRPPSAVRHSPPVICCQLSSRNSPPNQVDCRCRHRPLSLHHSPPRRLTHRIVCRPPSARQHRHRCHRCNPLPTPTALVALSTLSARRRHCCRNPLLALTAFVTPFAARSRRAIPPSAQQHCPRHCHRDFLMQKLQDADVDVNVGVNCVALRCCSQRSPPPLLSLSSSPCCSHHCCHPYNCEANAAR